MAAILWAALGGGTPAQAAGGYTISEFAGGGKPTPCQQGHTDPCGDGGPATGAALAAWAVALDGAGNVLIADEEFSRVRRVAGDGTIGSIAGDGTVCGSGPEACGDGGPAISAQFIHPLGVATDPEGNVYVADASAQRVREVHATGPFAGEITGFAGEGTPCAHPTDPCGDGEAATGAQLLSPEGLAVDKQGNVFIADAGDNRVREVYASGPLKGKIVTVAGTGATACAAIEPCGDGGQAASAEIDLPLFVTIDPSGNLLIADWLHARVREVRGPGQPHEGEITTIAGNGTPNCPDNLTGEYTPGGCGDGTSAASAPLGRPGGMAVDGAGDLFVAVDDLNVVREVTAGGTLQTIAGTGTACSASLATGPICGDGGPATAAEFNDPRGLALAKDCKLYVADANDFRVRVLTPPSETPGCPGSGGGGGGGGSGGGGGGGSGGGSGGGGSGGGAGPGGSGSGTGQGNPPQPPTPSLAIAASRPGAPLLLDASGTNANGSQILAYRFQLSSDPNQAVECGANAPVAHANFAGPAKGTATLTVRTASGATVTTSQPYLSSGPTLLKRARRAASTVPLARQALVSVQCLPAAGSQPKQLVVGGKPIDPSCEVHAGLVIAAGCGLHQVELCSGVPSAERSTLEAHAYGGCVLRTNQLEAVFARSGRSGRRAALGPRLRAELPPSVDAYYVSTEPVRINGLDVVPNSGAAIVIAVGGRYSTSFFTHSAAYVVSSGADVDLGSLPLQLGQKLDLNVNPQIQRAVHVVDFNLKHPLPFLPEFSDLPLVGTLSADLVTGGATQLAAHVELPEVFTDQDGKGLTTDVTLKTTNTEGLVLDSFNVSIPSADLGFAEVQEVKLAYSRAEGTFDGSAGVTLPSGDTAKATIGFLHGNFNEFSFDYAFGPGEGIEVFDGIYLTELFGGLKLNPTEFDNGGRISLGPSVTDEGCGSVDIRGDLNIHFGPLPFAIDSTGTTEILCQNVGERYFHVDSEGHVILGEAINFDIPNPESGDNPSIAHLSGNIDGQAYVDLKDQHFHFQFDGEIKASLGVFGFSTEVEAEAVISDAGFGLCATVEGPFKTHLASRHRRELRQGRPDGGARSSLGGARRADSQRRRAGRQLQHRSVPLPAQGSRARFRGRTSRRHARRKSSRQTRSTSGRHACVGRRRL